MKTIVPVTYEDWRRLFKSRDFKERLTKAALDTRQYREENQFNVARDFRGKTYFGDVVHKTDVADDPDVSTHGNFLDGLQHKLAAAHLDYRKPDVFPLLVFHTHAHSCPAPSDSDLRDMENLRSSCAKGGSHYKYDIMPLYAIASWQQETLEVLMLQEKKK